MSVLLAAVMASAAGAATISVPAGAADSSGTCSASPCPNLRSAIAYANANANTTISLAAGTYALSLGELDLTQSATIVGQGASATKIAQTDGTDRVLEIGAGPAVTVQGLEITGGTANVATTVIASDRGGGGILDQAAQLTLDHVLLDHNSVVGANGMTSGLSGAGADAYGGGIDLPYSPPGPGTRALTITNSTISDNTAQGGNGGNTMSEGFGSDGGSGGGALGGGIYAGQQTTIAVTDTTLSGNRAVGGAGGADLVTPATTGPANAGLGGTAAGGAISTAYGSTDLIRDTLSSNSATGGTPGADIYSAAHVGTGGDGAGGAFGPGEGASGMSPLYIENSTFTGNTASGGASGVGTVNGGVAGSGYGGALQLLPVGTSREVTIYSSTLYGNSATGDGGGGTGTGGGNIDIFGTKLDLQGTIIAGGSAPASTGNCRTRVSSPAATIIDDGNNLESSTPSQCGLSTANSDVIGIDPQLRPLADNGGPTQTMMLGAGSPALNAGGACFVTVDQRDLARPSGICDIGAFQHQASVTKTADAAISGTPVVGQTLTCGGATFTGGSLTLSYAWLRNGTAIIGAPNSTYTLVSADAGTQVSCRVTATGAAGTATSTSAAVTVSAPAGPGGGTGKPGAPSFPSQKLIAATDGSVSVTVSCSSGSSACTGTLQLTVTKVGNAYIATTNVRHPKRKVIVIASHTFTITAGHKRTIKLGLTKLGRSLLRSHPHGLAVTIRLVKRSKTILSKRSKLNTAPPRRHH